ncbi:hypothetical protein [Luteimicrobium sp. DT211]|uniref:hypothetical protein n=1 Tax=Luteimicrobium sp. DT211 TaxID=3393412 RepID=UPI003CEDC20F
MSTTAPLPSPSHASAALRALVAGYAGAVRRELDDLPPDTVDDLTDGLEADLLDALADTPAGFSLPDDGTRPGTGLTDTVVAPPVGGAAAGGARGAGTAPSSDAPLTAEVLTARFGAPEDYAAELRSSAGLAPRVAAPAAATRRGMGGAWAETRAAWAERWRELRASARWKPVFDFLEVLRPVWWVGRAWVLVTAILWSQASPVGLAPTNGWGWILLLAAVICSVQWGRGAWDFPVRFRWVGQLLAAAAVVLLLPTTATALAWSTPDTGWGDGSAYEQGVRDATPSDGVWVDGQQATNLFVYGADGKLVDGARVFDEAGNPVLVLDPSDDTGRGSAVVPDGDGTELWLALPSLDRAGRTAWNAYPLERVPLAKDEYGNAQHGDEVAPVTQAGASPKAPVAPFDEVSPLASRGALPSGAPLPSDGAPASPTPSGAVGPVPSSDARPTPSRTGTAK